MRWRTYRVIKEADEQISGEPLSHFTTAIMFEDQNV
jgi:hypothetical protein